MIAVEPVRAISLLTHVISDDPTPDLLLSHIALNTLDSLGCREIELGLISTQGFINIIGRFGVKAKTAKPKIEIPLWETLPITDCIRTGEILYLDSSKNLISKYPTLTKSTTDSSQYFIAAPIKYRHAVIGAIYLTCCREPRSIFRESKETETLLGLLGIFLSNFMKNQSKVPKSYIDAGGKLTPRQIKIIELFQENLTTDQIASKLRFSSSTIKQDIIKIYEIFSVHSRIEVVERAKKVGLVKPDLDR